jgi:hypothetical protein
MLIEIDGAVLEVSGTYGVWCAFGLLFFLLLLFCYAVFPGGSRVSVSSGFCCCSSAVRVLQKSWLFAVFIIEAGVCLCFGKYILASLFEASCWWFSCC